VVTVLARSPSFGLDAEGRGACQAGAHTDTEPKGNPMGVVNSGSEDVVIVGNAVGRTVTSKAAAAATRAATRGDGVAVVNVGGGTVTVGGRKSGKGSK